MKCNFVAVRIGDKWLNTCSECGSVVITKTKRVVAECHGNPGDPFDCVYRSGEHIREEKCELCGMLDKSERIYSCEIHGECSLRRYQHVATTISCLTCPDRTPAGVASSGS